MVFMNDKTGVVSLPVLKNAQGDIRQVGFEMEYTGINLAQTSDLVVSLLGGEVVRKNAFSVTIKDTSIGNVALELDMPLLKNEVYKTYLEALGIVLEAEQMASVEQLLDDAVSAVVPYEIVLPPLPMNNFQVVEALREAMLLAGAKGTHSSFAYAFGLHINPELPALDLGVMVRYMQAFLLLEDWIRVQSQIDWTRRLTPFINPFPKGYKTHVLDVNYDSTWNTFLKDYITHNPTRYRSLDLLPALAWVDKDGLRALFSDADTIGARPTFHYRLPNCRLNDPLWRITQEWHYWVLVEMLANDDEKRKKMLQAFQISKGALIELLNTFVGCLDV